MQAFVVHICEDALAEAAAMADENDASALDRAAAALEKDALAVGLGTLPVAVLPHPATAAVMRINPNARFMICLPFRPPLQRSGPEWRRGNRGNGVRKAPI